MSRGPLFLPLLKIAGWLLVALGMAMLLPAAADLMADNPDWQAFVGSAVVTIFIGALSIISTWGAVVRLDAKQAVLLTVGSWLAVAVFASLPMTFADLGLSYTDAFFEAMSGITTTGSTVMTGLDKAPPGILLWRGLLQWLGGIGIIVLGVALLPFLKIGGMQLFRLESSEKSEKIVPQFRRFIVVVIQVYVGLTAVCAALLMIAGMSPFDAGIHSMTTLSTGGFSTSDGSVGHFNNHLVEWTITVFMFLGGIPFILYVGAAHGRARDLFRSSQARNMLRSLIAVVAAITAWLWWIDGVPAFDSLRLAAFNVTSIVTTTGFVTADYTQWGTFPLGIFFLLTFIGGCTGSTAGGIKIFRFEILVLTLRSYLLRLVYPHAVHLPTYNNRPLSLDVATGGLLYISVFIATTVVVALGLEAMGIDLVTGITAAATAVANVGPGLGSIVGPAGNFASLPDGAKWLLALAMLMGRLELFTVLLLLMPSFWRA